MICLQKLNEIKYLKNIYLTFEFSPLKVLARVYNTVLQYLHIHLRVCNFITYKLVYNKIHIILYG